MGCRNYFFQVQDTVLDVPQSTIINPVQSSGLKIERKAIEISSFRELTSDSARPAPVKIIKPVVKTIPFIPVNDSIHHPEYNVLTGNFEFSKEYSFFDSFGFAPFELAVNSELSYNIATEPKLIEPINNVAVLKETIAKDGFVKERNEQSNGFLSTDWMLMIIIFSLILFGWLKVGYNRFFQAAVQASYNFFAARRIFEEANVTRSRVFQVMNLLFFTNMALFTTQYLEFQNIAIFNLQGIFLFSLVFAGFLLLYGVKSFVFYTLDFLFLTKGGFSAYVFTFFLYNKMVGFVLLPIVAVLPFVPTYTTQWLFMLGIFVIGFLYIFRIFKGLQLCFKNRLSIFYLFLYLCALEILPVLILFKVASYCF